MPIALGFHPKQNSRWFKQRGPAQNQELHPTHTATQSNTGWIILPLKIPCHRNINTAQYSANFPCTFWDIKRKIRKKLLPTVIKNSILTFREWNVFNCFFESNVKRGLVLSKGVKLNSCYMLEVSNIKNTQYFTEKYLNQAFWLCSNEMYQSLSKNFS